MFLKKANQEENLVSSAFKEAIEMLAIGREMFDKITTAMVESSKVEDWDEISATDKKINKMHRNIRKKLFEHLSISGGKDLYSSLILLNVINDIERIGDYNKNIADLLSMVPHKLEVGDYGKVLDDIYKETYKFYELTETAFENEDENSAKLVLTSYRKLAKKSDRLLEQIFEDHKAQQNVHKDLIPLVLLLRYFKRLNAHLKNIASTVINPFHRIGYRFKDKK